MKPYPSLMIAAVLTWAAPAVAQDAPANPPADLAAAARDALARVNAMTPEQRAAAAATAKERVPVLLGEASQWWATLTPEQQAAYRAQLKGLLPPKAPKPPKDQ